MIRFVPTLVLSIAAAHAAADDLLDKFKKENNAKAAAVKKHALDALDMANSAVKPVDEKDKDAKQYEVKAVLAIHTLKRCLDEVCEDSFLTNLERLDLSTRLRKRLDELRRDFPTNLPIGEFEAPEYYQKFLEEEDLVNKGKPIGKLWHHGVPAELLFYNGYITPGVLHNAGVGDIVVTVTKRTFRYAPWQVPAIKVENGAFFYHWEHGYHFFLTNQQLAKVFNPGSVQSEATSDKEKPDPKAETKPLSPPVAFSLSRLWERHRSWVLPTDLSVVAEKNGKQDVNNPLRDMSLETLYAKLAIREDWQRKAIRVVLARMLDKRYSITNFAKDDLKDEIIPMLRKENRAFAAGDLDRIADGTMRYFHDEIQRRYARPE